MSLRLRSALSPLARNPALARVLRLLVPAAIVIVLMTYGALRLGGADVVIRASGIGPVLGGTLPGPLPLFPSTNWWNLDVSAAPLDSQSAAFINFINNGSLKHLHPDLGGDVSPGSVNTYGMPYIVVDGTQPKKTVKFYYSDESDGVDHTTNQSFPFYPIPDQAITTAHWIEGGEPGNVDVRNSNDRHMIVVDRDNKHLYELYNVFYDGTGWQAGSGAFFDMNTDNRRPDGWTSADAAGLAILPGLIRYDEVFGPAEIGHAFRFTVRATNGYVYPASHRAGSTSGALPMGARLRLKASKDISSFPPEVQKIFRAMKKYGLIVADNGSDMFITGTYDTRWDNSVLNPAFSGLTASDFEVVQLGYNPPTPPPPPSTYTLSVGLAGTGQGMVTSGDGAISCGSVCSAPYASGQAAVLTAEAFGGSTFAGWSGDADCLDGLVTMTANRSCTATFSLLPGAGPPPAAVDLNGDGLADLFLYKSSSGQWWMELSAGAGPFGVKSGSWPSGLSVTPVDLNGDGLTDFVGYNRTTGARTAFVNGGAGTFTTTAGSWATGLRLFAARLNADDYGDLLGYNASTGRWFEYTGNGAGGFTALKGLLWPAGLQIYPADFDADGRTDVFALDPSTGEWFQAFNTGVGGFRFTRGEWAVPANVQVAVGDVDEDGRADVVTYFPRSGTWTEALTLSTGGFSYKSGTWPKGGRIAAADMDGNGAADVFFFNPTDGSWTEYLNTGPGQFVAALKGTGVVNCQVFVTDFDSDGRSDLLAYNGSSGGWLRLLNTGAGAVTASSGTWATGLTVVARTGW